RSLVTHSNFPPSNTPDTHSNYTFHFQTSPRYLDGSARQTIEGETHYVPENCEIFLLADSDRVHGPLSDCPTSAGHRRTRKEGTEGREGRDEGGRAHQDRHRLRGEG